ncbi:MAG: M50 family metallopeptidase [Dehalococcoidia bacterium]
MALTIIIGILTLSVLVIAHELGHYFTAKWTGVKVEEFGLGMPPRIWGIQRGETLYSINWIPFGGFCKMLGEEDPTYPRSLASKSHATRVLILSAGCIVNILLPIILFSISYMVPHNIMVETIQIQQVAANSPAQRAGMEAGDVLLAIDNNPVNNRGEVSYYLQMNLGKETPILLQKADQTEEVVTVTPRWNPPEGQGATGIQISGIDSHIEHVSLPFWEAIPKSVVHCWEILVIMKNEIGGWFIRGQAPEGVAGPVGVVQITGEVAKAGLSPDLEIAALNSLSLGIFNLFPLPALDGGRLVFVGLEWVRRGKRISPKKEGMVHFIGFVMLIMVLVVVTYQDIARIISGESLIP